MGFMAVVDTSFDQTKKDVIKALSSQKKPSSKATLMEIVRIKDSMYVVDEGVPLAKVVRLQTIEYGDVIVALAEGDDMKYYLGISRVGNRDFFEVYAAVEKTLAQVAA
jgi:hypothetical protein